MSPLETLARGFLESGRYRRALESTEKALEEAPDDAELLALRAWALLGMDRGVEALEAAEYALSCDPDSLGAQGARGEALLATNRPAEAETVAREALGKYPRDTFYLGLLARSYLLRSRWREAQAVAEQGLVDHPEDVALMQIAGLARTHLGSGTAPREQIEAALSRDPEDPSTHCLAGLEALHRGDHREALDHLGESLRLEPDSTTTRSLYIEALKARNPLYGAFLRVSLWFSRLSPRTGLALIVGAWLLVQVLRRVENAWPAVSPFVGPITLLYLGVVLMSWFWSPIFDALLLLSRDGRRALPPRHQKFALLLGTMLVAAAVLLVTGVRFDRLVLVASGITLLGAALQFHSARHVVRPLLRRLQFLYGTLLLVVCGGAIAASLAGWLSTEVAAGTLGGVIWAAVIGTWFALGAGAGDAAAPQPRRRPRRR